MAELQVTVDLAIPSVTAEAELEDVTVFMAIPSTEVVALNKSFLAELELGKRPPAEDELEARQVSVPKAEADPGTIPDPAKVAVDSEQDRFVSGLSKPKIGFCNKLSERVIIALLSVWLIPWLCQSVWLISFLQ